jgi:hypothetical protein
MQLLNYLLIPLLLAACMDHSENITGRFTGTQQFGIGQVDSPIVLELQQNGQTITGTVTPPFSGEAVPIVNGRLEGSILYFDRKEGEITYRYQATLNTGRSTVQGSFQPVGCIDPESGEPCQTDSDGSFTAEKQ